MRAIFAAIMVVILALHTPLLANSPQWTAAREIGRAHV